MRNCPYFSECKDEWLSSGARRFKCLFSLIMHKWSCLCKILHCVLNSLMQQFYSHSFLQIGMFPLLSSLRFEFRSSQGKDDKNSNALRSLQLKMECQCPPQHTVCWIIDGGRSAQECAYNSAHSYLCRWRRTHITFLEKRRIQRCGEITRVEFDCGAFHCKLSVGDVRGFTPPHSCAFTGSRNGIKYRYHANRLYSVVFFGNENM